MKRQTDDIRGANAPEIRAALAGRSAACVLCGGAARAFHGRCFGGGDRKGAKMRRVLLFGIAGNFRRVEGADSPASE